MVNDRQSLDLTTSALAPGGVEWRISALPVPYPDAVAEMEARVADIASGQASELVWLLEHPPLYTRHQRQTKRPARPALSDV
jgi:Lipoate-protein ligase B